MGTNWWRTLELRWFMPGSIPPRVEDWFVAGERFERRLTVAERQGCTESYLIPFGAHDLGVKLGNEQLEIERKIESHPVLHAAGSVRGIPETWAKWMWKNSGPWSGREVDWVRGEFRVEVAKVRWQRRVALRHEGDRAFAEFDHLGVGFTIGLTQVVLGEEPWWTLAFCVNGGLSADPMAVLREGTSWTLEHFPEGERETLQTTNSYSYPVWLATCGSLRQDRNQAIQQN